MNLCQEVKPKTALEIGFGTGRSTVSVLYCGTLEKMISVDKDLSWTGKYKDEILTEIKASFPQFQLLEDDSKNVLSKQFFEQEYKNGIDFVFIDGDHGFEGCFNDIEKTYPHLSSRGVMLVDDYTALDGVRKAVDKFGAKFTLWQQSKKSFAVFRKDA